jgi:hypothetical protein
MRGLGIKSAALLAAALAACGGSGSTDDAGSPNDAATPSDAPLSCEDLLDRWRMLVGELRGCDAQSDCGIVGGPGGCDGPSIECATVANAAAYENSRAAEIEAELFARDCEPSIADCPPIEGYDCIDGQCRIVREGICFGSTHSGTMILSDVSAPGHAELGRGAWVRIEYVELYSGSSPVYDDIAPPGVGCRVLVYDSAGTDRPKQEDGGAVAISSALSSLPSCAFDASRMEYRCVAAAGAAQIGDTQEVIGGGEVEVEIAGAAFDPTHVGHYLELTGSDDPIADGGFPIVAYLTATRVRIALSPLGVDTGWSGAGAYAVVGGAGPTPASVPFLDDGSNPVTIDKAAGIESEAFSVDMLAGGAGFALDASSTSVDDLPTDGSAATFSCAGSGGNCGSSSIGNFIFGRTTTAPVTGLADYAMPEATAGSVAEFWCRSFAGDIEISAGAMAAILATNPTRIETRVLRSNYAPAGDSSGLNQWGLVAGHGLVGYTTVPSSP